MNVSFEDALRMVARACRAVFYDGTHDKEKTVIECATKIYLEVNNKERRNEDA